MNNEVQVQEVNEVEELAQLGNAITEGFNVFEKEISKASEEMNKRMSHLQVAANLKGSLDRARKVLKDGDEFEKYIKPSHEKRLEITKLMRKQKRLFVYPRERFEVILYDNIETEMEGCFRIRPHKNTEEIVIQLPYQAYWEGKEKLDVLYV